MDFELKLGSIQEILTASLNRGIFFYSRMAINDRRSDHGLLPYSSPFSMMKNHANYMGRKSTR